ncbi:uncharacterized protein LOC120665088 [Panicum virgatum]|uniref:uncharacterized protein LOC120665088 n=1 Tax=Panicum virgatum TaxID=38727 RepID=UPI0019D60E26|nr:uncharacterized protein LOC120665088 [Panicum virgatum]
MTRATKSEIETYLEEDTEEDSENFDVLAWWKARTEKFPMLSTMARDFLAIPLSTVSSESAFSLGGRLLGDARSSLTPETLEALVCGKDWLYMEKIMDNENNLVHAGQLCGVGVSMTGMSPQPLTLQLTGQIHLPIKVLVQRVSIHCERRKRRASQGGHIFFQNLSLLGYPLFGCFHWMLVL